MDPLNVLQGLGRGRLLEELTAALASVADEVVQTGKPGSVTLTLKLSTQEQGDPMVQIIETIARKTPTKAARGAIVFAIEGWLYSKDPRQGELQFREVERPTADQRELDDAAPIVREAN